MFDKCPLLVRASSRGSITTSYFADQGNAEGYKTTGSVHYSQARLFSSI